MNHKSNERTTSLTQNAALQPPLKRFGVGLAAVALACFGLASLTLAQTSVVCDPAGDATTVNTKGGPEIPAWLDIVQTEITDAGSDIRFTLTLNAAIPVAPAWDHVDDGGQLWWGWRFVGDLTQATFIKDGCVKAAGNIIPAAYFLDLIWDVPSSSFRARLLDDTTCSQNDVPFLFSNNRTQVTLLLSKSLLTNRAVLPNPNTFQYFAQTTAWKPNNTGNSGLVHLDNAPDETDHGGLVVAPWSAFENATYFCQ
jgi:hypothetical protein